MVVSCSCVNVEIAVDGNARPVRRPGMRARTTYARGVRRGWVQTGCAATRLAPGRAARYKLRRDARRIRTLAHPARDQARTADMEMRLAHAYRHGDSSGDDALARLVPRVAEGDERALEELYAATSARVFGLALRILRDRPSAEEAVVDVYAQVWRQAERYDPAKGTVASWITTLARTRSIDLARIQRRRTQRDTDVTPELADTLSDPGAGPALAAAGGDHAERVRAALERLPRDQRVAVELAFFSGLSHTEVARTLCTPLGTIKTRIRTGLSNLRSALAAVEGDL